MPHHDTELVSLNDFTRTRSELGAAFPRILGYFREDGAKSIRAIEDAFRARTAAALITPAHTLKGESAQFGAYRLSAMAEEIEMVARRCVEMHQSPDELIEVVVALRACFAETMALLDGHANPLTPRRPTGFGRRLETSVQGFGRAV